MIVGGATRRFLAAGYVGTTIEDVAAEADVAVQTIYYLFGTKPKLLAAVVDASIAGDTDPTAVMDRPWVEALQSSVDPGAAISLLATAAVEIVTRAAPIYEVLRQASADPEVFVLLDETRRRRRRDQRGLVEILAQAGHLAPGVDISAAADVVYALISEEIVHLLVTDCGWSTARLRAWVTGVLGSQLLEGGATLAAASADQLPNHATATAPRTRRKGR